MTQQRNTFDLYQTVTDQIIEAIETSQAEGYQLPWHRAGSNIFMPTNAKTGNAYQGINILCLWASAEIRRFTSGTWATYKQFIPNTDDVEDSEEPEPRWFAKSFRVFNADQVDGYDDEELPKTSLVERIEAADRFVRATGAEIHHGGGRAFYHQLKDTIQMPDEVRFRDSETRSATEGYYSTLFHELTHWTGPENRCNRDLDNRFGDDAYAMEELVAELWAAFLCAELAVSPQPREDHTGYIQHWMKVMKADKKAIFTTAARANEAADFLTGR